jgi:hypothetical protein
MKAGLGWALESRMEFIREQIDAQHSDVNHRSGPKNRKMIAAADKFTKV